MTAVSWIGMLSRWPGRRSRFLERSASGCWRGGNTGVCLRLASCQTPASGDLDKNSALALVEQLLVDVRDETWTLWLKSEYSGQALDPWRSEWYFGSPAKGGLSIKPGERVYLC